MLLFDDEMLRMVMRVANEQIRKRGFKKCMERSTDLIEL